jgi:hypothetical protein
MFGFGKRSAPAPTRRKSNPGITAEGKVAFSNGGRSWTEHFNTVTLLASVLKEKGHSAQKEKTWLVEKISGFVLLPQLVELQPLDSGGVQTVTTIQINHSSLTPDGIFEYQHSTGENVADALSKGFDQWAQMDFVPLLQALQLEPKLCTAMVMEFPATDSKPARTRRALLGPVMHYMQNPPSKKGPITANQGQKANADEEHPFCPCCLLTRSFEAFKELIEGESFCGIRLFAARDSERVAQADCRVNGEDWEKGAQALRAYVGTWPEAGYEFRKQYVVLQTLK